MKKLKFFTILSTALIMLAVQIVTAFAAPSLQDGVIEGTITALACGDDSENPTVLITLDEIQTVEVSLETAVALGIIDLNTECSPETLADAIGTTVSIDPTTVIEEPQHPVGAALAEYFVDIADYDTIYDMIMAAHEEGTGFGVLAQALWLTTKMEGNSETFQAVVDAKKSKDFSAFELADGSTPTNWGQFKKAVLDGDKKGNLGVVMSGKDKTNNGQNKDKSNNGKGDENSNKDKKDK